MLAKAISVSSETKEYDQCFHAAFTAVRQARVQHVKVRPLRAITPLKINALFSDAGCVVITHLAFAAASKQTHAAGFLARLHSFLVEQARPSV